MKSTLICCDAERKAVVEDCQSDSCDANCHDADPTTNCDGDCDCEHENGFCSWNLNFRHPSKPKLSLDSTTTTTRHRADLECNSKRPISVRSSKVVPMVLLMTMVVLCEMNRFRFHAQGFSSVTVLSEAGRTARLFQQRPKFKFQNQSTRHPGRNRNSQAASAAATNYYASALFSNSPLVEPQEATIPLEWIEYFSPEVDDNDTPTQPETPVLFLHGLLGSKRNFVTCANKLAFQLDKKRRIMGVDLRNHGDTQPWSESMSYPSMAQDVVNFLKSQNIQEVILVGHSMGGKVAQALALLHPEYVEGLVVLDIAPVKYSREEDPHWRVVEDILRAINRVIEEAAATGAETNKRDIDLSLRKSIPDPALRAFVLTNFDSRKNEWKIPIATMVQELEQIAGFDLTTTTSTTPALEDSSSSSTSSTYEGDVFIINGGQSRFVRHSYMDQIASYFPNHMLTTIRGSGHWVHAEAPDDLVALLKQYLDR